MKKMTAFLLVLMMSASLVACGSSKEAEPETSDTTEVMEDVTESETEETEETTEETEQADATETTNETEAGSKVLVAYFSATHTTEGVAEKLSDGMNADLYEIVPEEPYTDADLNYNDDNSRTTTEMNDPSARPAIAGSVENMDQYDVVFVGYPIWWGEAPRIISTFMESYDFSGKTIIPFCTSGGSGIDGSVSGLEQLTDGANWVEGKRLSKNDSQETIMEWVNGLGLNLGE